MNAIEIRGLRKSFGRTEAPDTPFKAITVLLSCWGVSGVPVVDADGTVVGVVSQRDLLEREIRHRLLRFRPGYGARCGEAAPTS
ncbi:CBS domain-containing protein [Amycolatopsis keratiniphila]|uniref:CBS domain containing membrane protein n=1 Tax=Amycolatopsis keratiniphila TaxID=129921 RepID=R4T8A3_9PSEU|nr:CBS domain-containing protein [Amycolatopsis keratiniphila]AGM07182.1 CBS domain containing membrane protein [Amycolatopsis keratiniphila]